MMKAIESLSKYNNNAYKVGDNDKARRSKHKQKNEESNLRQKFEACWDSMVPTCFYLPDDDASHLTMIHGADYPFCYVEKVYFAPLDATFYMEMYSACFLRGYNRCIEVKLPPRPWAQLVKQIHKEKTGTKDTHVSKVSVLWFRKNKASQAKLQPLQRIVVLRNVTPNDCRWR